MDTNIIQSANQILRNNNFHNYKSSNNRYDFVVNVKSIIIERIKNQGKPIIQFKNIQGLGTTKDLYNDLIIAKYSNKFLKLHQLKPNDMLSLTASIKSLHNCLEFTNINNLRYVSYPDDFILRRIVPKNLNTRIGFVLTMNEPPLTNSNGKIELNYPYHYKQDIKKYLKWLKRK